MPRLFTGLEIPADVGFALSLKRGGLTGARWIDPENYHITLRFIGDVDHQTANEVSYSLDRLINSMRFSVRLTQLGTFGGSKPRALYAGVEPSEQLRGGGAVHRRGGPVRAAELSRRPVRAVFEQGFGGRRALCGRAELPAGRLSAVTQLLARC
jgi:hypothetical protein